MIMEWKFQSVIIFSFSRRKYEQHAMSMSKLDFNTENEKDVVNQIYENSILCLNEEDKNLHSIELIFSHKLLVLGWLGTFNDLDHHQVAALASCFIPGEKSNGQIYLGTELGKPLQQLQESA
ncbi:hypothetical protein GIB67_016163 [Kingdonia uniflora]|uniref:ATP-dependent RNA helicase Ski2/MTR4 C-terminal domain-containing protein n=1 Tax=Kingdonia uniflora TaxID=39325 RepID=A0A7J7N9Q5_9MAGN|nr:hypothetical protein GIB67_016163 [Kingdonia uniflora]